MHTKAPFFVTSDEILLLTYSDGEHVGRSGPFLDKRDILAMLSAMDGVEQVLCINPKVQSTIDISEQVAELYIETFDLAPDDDIAHPFVRNSLAYATLLVEWAEQTVKDIYYGTYEQQHRLRASDVL
ncbi:hypothetical protein [Bartonella sp. DGB2]|uniref:hypothetical protein n=1 Tax=Bartonella sp. DGB2 TaxID=3388426 RepID=UPI00398FA9E4